eukprot:COSAG01_NODE_8877_length_2628_cov_13.758007_4_plen_169_part_00
MSDAWSDALAAAMLHLQMPVPCLSYTVQYMYAMRPMHAFRRAAGPKLGSFGGAADATIYTLVLQCTCIRAQRRGDYVTVPVGRPCSSADFYSRTTLRSWIGIANRGQAGDRQGTGIAALCTRTAYGYGTGTRTGMHLRAVASIYEIDTSTAVCTALVQLYVPVSIPLS